MQLLFSWNYWFLSDEPLVSKALVLKISFCIIYNCILIFLSFNKDNFDINIEFSFIYIEGMALELN